MGKNNLSFLCLPSKPSKKGMKFSMDIKQDLGKFGENKAYEFLIKNGYKVIDRNFLCRQGEIDIIAISNLNELIFIEVKTRTNLKYGMPCEAVTPYKIRNIIYSSKYYIMLYNLYDISVRYDVIEVFVNKSNYRINHIKNAF